LWDEPDEDDAGSRPLAVSGPGWSEQPVHSLEVPVDEGDGELDDGELDDGDRGSDREFEDHPSPVGAPVAVEPAAHTEAPEDAVERPGLELLTGVFGLLLAVSAFLPWYLSGDFKVSGWASGTTGPLVVALGILVAAVVALRRFGVAVSLPLQAALILEGAGWLAVVAIIPKRFMKPLPALDRHEVYQLLALLLAVGVAMAGGTVSRTASLVLRPGWLAMAGGKIGAGLLGAVVVVAGFFGVTNDVVDPASFNVPQVVDGVPDCLKGAGFPIPKGVEATTGRQSDPRAEFPFCSVTLESRVSVNTTLIRYRSALRDAGYRIVFADKKGSPLRRLQAQKESDCLTLAHAPGVGTGKKVKSTVTVNLVNLDAVAQFGVTCDLRAPGGG